MAKPSPHKKEATLLGAIKQAASQTSAAPPAEKLDASAQARQAPVIKPGKFQIYAHPEDRRLIRELAAWFNSQGLRITDSLVIKSALRAVKPGSELLAAYQEAAQLDQRFKKPEASK